MDCTNSETLLEVMDSTLTKLIVEEKKPETNYQILSVEEIIELVNLISHALSKIELLQITPPAAKVLLDFYGWDVSWLEKNLLTNRKILFKLAGIEDPRPKTKSIISEFKKAVGKLAISDKASVCGYCKDETFNQFKYAPYCKHNYCDRCWFILLNHQLKYPIATLYVKCPALKCIISYKTVMHFIFENKVADFQYSTIRSFVENNDYIYRCPNLNCTYLIKVENVQVRKVQCKCGHTYCFKCKQEWHSPITCEILQKWLQMWQNHRSKNSKACTKCNLILRKQEKCPLCLTNSEKEEEKKKGRQKLSTDDFYRLSYTGMCYELESQIKPNCNLKSLIRNCLDVDETSRNDRDIGELQKYINYIVVIAYFLKGDNPFIKFFFKYLKKLKNAINFIYNGISLYYNKTLDNKFKKKIKNKIQLAYYFMEILNNVITEGCNEGWWSFKEDQ